MKIPSIFRRFFSPQSSAASESPALNQHQAHSAPSGPQWALINSQIARLLRDTDFIKHHMAAYLGNSESLTYLRDETPIFVNTDDMGCPINYINGGLYEEENFTVFRSYRTPDYPMLDIGANLGYYTLRMLPYYRKQTIHAFEPNPRIASLFAKSLFLNGATERVQIHQIGVSDSSQAAALGVPAGHAGGAFVGSSDLSSIPNLQKTPIRLEPLDSYMPPAVKCGLVKLDVEGHELSALRGMLGMLKRSPECIVMFEKLAAHSGIEAGLIDLFEELDWRVYYISGTRLTPITKLAALQSAQGYFIAGRRPVVEDGGLDRSFYHIFPADFVLASASVSGDKLVYTHSDKAEQLVAYGPYWPLTRGRYRVTFIGSIHGALQVKVCEHFGHEVYTATVSEKSPSFEFEADHDLLFFELAMRTAEASLVISKVVISKL